MLSSLKAAVTLLSLLQLIASSPLTATIKPRVKVSEIIRSIQQLSSRGQVPCNDTRVGQVAFTDPKLSEQELLCQAASVLAGVAKCRDVYQPLILNLQTLQSKKKCSVSNETEIYLCNFLPQLGNFTQGLYRRLGRQ